MLLKNFSKKTLLILFLFSVLLMASLVAGSEIEECTIGVAAGKATVDGRSLLWKTRDNSSAPNNEVIYNTCYQLKFIEVVTAGETYAWMGVNEKGFAILNSLSKDLPIADTGPTNGKFMREALGTCATVDDFENLLIATNTTGRKTRANFGVIDSTGAAAIFETAGNEYWKFDANDSTIAPNGYVLRTNFAFNGEAKNGLHDGIYSIERYRRQQKLISDFYAGDSLSYRSIIRYQMRDFSDFDSNPLPVPFPDRWRSDRPYGYIYTNVSICRSSSVSATVIQGVLPGESPQLSTMWTILGQPASAIAIPYFPVGNTPAEANGSDTAPLCDIANQIRSLLFDYPENSYYIDSYKLRDETGNGIWAKTFPAEDSIFTVTGEQLEVWRNSGFNKDMILAFEKSLAQYTRRILTNIFNEMMSTEIVLNDHLSSQVNHFKLFQNYPNPFNGSTTINFHVPVPAFIQLKIYNLLGEEVAAPVSNYFNAGTYSKTYQMEAMPSGIYLYRLEARSIAPCNSDIFYQIKKMNYIK